jgi:hypothetical protein
MENNIVKTPKKEKTRNPVEVDVKRTYTFIES